MRVTGGGIFCKEILFGHVVAYCLLKASCAASREEMFFCHCNRTFPQLKTAVVEHYAEGTIEVLTGPHQNVTAETLAVFTVPSTGSWENFKEFKVKLKRPVSGKTNLVFRFSKTGCCNFAGWRFL